MRGWENVTHADIEQLKNKSNNFAYEQKKSKYGANKTLEDGILFDSKHESERYKELKILERFGKIDNLRLQVPFELQPAYEIDGEKRRAITYVADFVYTEDGKTVVEDAKGMRTQVYKIKRKMFEYKYKTKIKEV